MEQHQGLLGEKRIAKEGLTTKKHKFEDLTTQFSGLKHLPQRLHRHPSFEIGSTWMKAMAKEKFPSPSPSPSDKRVFDKRGYIPYPSPRPNPSPSPAGTLSSPYRPGLGLPNMDDPHASTS